MVGLGNPGPRYKGTRHNVGFMVAAELIRRGRSGADRVQHEAVVTQVHLADRELVVVQPQTFMNLSGDAVAPVARRRGIEAWEIVLVYDDADLPLGRIRIRAGGSAGGHNGVQSVLDRLGTRDVMRIRLGIGKDEGELADRVLAPFTGAEAAEAARMVERAADAVELLAARGLTAAMNEYNRETE